MAAPALRQRAANRVHPRHPAGTLVREEGQEGRMSRVDPVAQHMHIARPPHGRHLDARHQREPQADGHVPRIRNGRDGVVVGHGEGRHARGVHASDQFGGAAAAVGRGRVQVQIDHVDGRSLRATRGRAAFAARLALGLA